MLPSMELSEPGASRLSGSPFTTDGNAVFCAFVVFAAYREAGFSVTQSLNMPGLLYGDDCVLCGLERAAIERVASDVGLKLKCKECLRGTPAGFLGRVSEIHGPRNPPTTIHCVL